MKRTILTLTLLLLLLPWTTAQAQQSDRHYCQLLASFATAVAQDRDAGVGKHRMFRIIGTEAVRSSKPFTEDMQTVIHYVYRYPHNTPRVEGNDVHETCTSEML